MCSIGKACTEGTLWQPLTRLFLCVLCLCAMMAVSVALAEHPTLPGAPEIPSTVAVFRINACEAGAVPDGKTDCTEALQKALQRAEKMGGGIVELPAGVYRIEGHLIIPANVTLQGVFQTAPTTARWGQTTPAGTVLLAYEGRGSEEGEPFLRLAGNHATVAGIAVVYPEWSPKDVPPVPYPPCIASTNTENVSIQNCLLVNPYEGIRLIRAHRHLVRNVTGYPIKRGIYVDECYDIGRIENVHFWPFGVRYRPDDPYCQWINLNGVAFEFARTDWHYVINTFCFGYGIGYKFSQSAHGSANGNFLGIGADSCQRAVVVEQAQPPGLLITNGEFVGRWGSEDAVTLEVGPDVQGKVSLVNCSFWGPIDRCVVMQSPRAQLTLSTCHFCEWDTANQGSPAVEIKAGFATIQGCTFDRDAAQHIHVHSGVRSVIVTANQAPGGLRVNNEAGRKVQMGLNAEDTIQWTPEARLHYRLHIGQPGDSRYLLGWYGAEKSDRTFRWSTPKSQLILPIEPGRSYELLLTVSVPKALDGKEITVTVGDQVLTALKSGENKVQIPAQNSEKVVLRICSPGWIPAESIKQSSDRRVLGIQVFSLIMKGEGAGEKIFDANTGEWQTP
ncbi:glycosyl hydrolase family 28-related protein [Thermogutta sp.]|uniref:glycosyl hydrolase family 28-related protein n=1 Tax=Thermogutta sp. TaxID=1962930 RepID=UPI003C7DAC3A